MARLRAAGHLELRGVLKALSWPETRDMALQVGFIQGSRETWAACQQLVAARQPGTRNPMVLLALAGGERERKLLVDSLGVPALRKDALWALGFCGHIEVAESCLEFMGDAQLARLAGESFSAVTGLEIKEQFAVEVVEEEQEQPIPLEEEDLDADLIPPPEAALPVPHVGEVRKWWQAERRRFDTRTRYLSGKPWEWNTLLESLAGAPMRRRHTLALDLARRGSGQIHVNTRALAHHQRLQLLQARRGGGSPRRSP
jgi:uncharacterized protein (TIGR02270 family)